MKSFSKIIGAILFSTVLFSCSSGDKEQSEEEISKKISVNWEADKERIMRVIDRHFLENTLPKGTTEYEFRDLMKSGMPIHFNLGLIEQDSLFPMSETSAFMKVNARTPQGVSLIFDYEVIAKESRDKADSMIYQVRGLNLRKVADEQRYFLKKEGNFWVKEIVKIAQ